MKPRASSPLARIEPLGSSMANTTAEPKILGPDWMKNGDLVLSVSVVGILMVMLLPLPRLILDLLLSLSITLSVDRKSTRLNSSHANISYAVFCLKKKKNKQTAYNINA